MQRHEFLQQLHTRLQPRTYLEVGVSSGSSMTLSRARSIGVDPAFTIKREVRCDLHLVRASSDEFFARPDPLEHFAGVPVDLAFIDGMHLAEYALRDLVNVGRHVHPASVVVLDDMLPRTPDQALRTRRRGHGAWAGDVYKVAEVVRATSPDAVVLEIDTAPTGVLVVLGLGTAWPALATAYDRLLPTLVQPDPQQVPAAVLERSTAHDPARLLDSGVVEALRGSRDRGADADEVGRVVESHLPGR